MPNIEELKKEIAEIKDKQSDHFVRMAPCSRCGEWKVVYRAVWLDPYTDTIGLARLCKLCMDETQEAKTSLVPIGSTRKADLSSIHPAPKPPKKEKRKRT